MKAACRRFFLAFGCSAEQRSHLFLQWRAKSLSTDERAARKKKAQWNEIGQFGLVTTWVAGVLQSGRKKNCRRDMNDARACGVDTQINAKSLSLDCVQFSGGWRPISRPEKQRASFRSRRVARQEKVVLRNNDILGPKTDTLWRVTRGKSEISYSGRAKNAQLGCVAARTNFHTSLSEANFSTQSMNFYGDSCSTVSSALRGSAGRLLLSATPAITDNYSNLACAPPPTRFH